MMKSRENRIFGRKNVFRKSVSLIILGIAILHQCAKFHEKKSIVQLKKYRFSGENRLFRRFLESSGFKTQFY